MLAFGIAQHWLETGVGDPRPTKSNGKAQTHQDAQFITALTALLQSMTIFQLMRAAQDIGQNSSIAGSRKAFWLRILSDWIAVKSRIPVEQDRAINFEIDRAHLLQTRWRLMANSAKSHCSNSGFESKGATRNPCRARRTSRSHTASIERMASRQKCAAGRANASPIAMGRTGGIKANKSAESALTRPVPKLGFIEYVDLPEGTHNELSATLMQLSPVASD